MISSKDLAVMTHNPRTELCVARDFTQCPGPRLRSEGPGSGQEFLEDYLVPLLREQMRVWKRHWHLKIDLDGSAGYTIGWLEEVFGGLVRMFGSEFVLRHVRFRCYDEPYLRFEIWQFIAST